MKGIIVDFLFPKGHKELNKNIISYLSHVSNNTVVVSEGYFKQELNDINNITLKKIRELNPKENAILHRWFALKNMLDANKLLRWDKFDFVWINTFETITFAIGRKIIKNKKIFIVHHNNTDELSNKIKRFFFNRYKNKVNHIVFEEFIKEYLIKEIGVNDKQIFVIPHPLNHQKKEVSVNCENILCIGLSNSNDESLITNIINKEEQSEIFRKNNIQLVLKSKGEHKDRESLKIIRGYIPEQQYDHYVQNCKFILVPFSTSYKNRTSGVIIDALSNGKIVIGSNIPIINSYADEYPNICYPFNDVDEIPNIILNLSIESQDIKKEFGRFRQAHSEDIIIEKLRLILSD